MGTRAHDLTGRRFGRLTVIRPDCITPPGARKGRVWLCACDCGTTRTVDGRALRRAPGHATASCGCFRRERSREDSTTHGLSTSPEHKAWRGAKGRCHTPTDARYPLYGARGIFMCDEWRDSFETFYRDMGPRPSPAYSLDRIDNDGPYAPENCRWATKTEQARNRRVAVHLAAFGRTRPLLDWCKEFRISGRTLRHRLARGVPVEDALTAPIQPTRARR